MKRRILELESQVLAQKSDHANRLTELLHQDEEKTRLLNVSKNSRPDQIAEEELTALKSSLEEALSKNTSLKLQLEVCQKSQSMARESTIELMKSSQQQTTQFAFEHSKQSVEFLKNELRHEQLAYHNKIIETYESQISDLEFRLNQQKNGTDQYDLQNRFDKVQQDYDELFFLHSFCESRIQRASTNIPPSLAELDRLTKRIQELESSSNTREAMLRSRKIDISNYDYDKENMARELRLKESQIRGFQKELNELITSFALIKAFK